MKSKEMFKVLLDRFADVAYSAGIVETEARAEAADAKDCAEESFVAGFDSRDDEVAELKEEINRLVGDVTDLVTQVGELEAKLRNNRLDVYEMGVKYGRESAVTQEAVAAIKNVVERTVIAATVLGVR